MAEVLRKLGPDPANREACATLARVLERARETLDGMQESSRSRQAIAMDMRYEQTVQRAMSVCRLSRGEGSDEVQPAVLRGVPRVDSLRLTSPCVFQRPSST